MHFHQENQGDRRSPVEYRAGKRDISELVNCVAYAGSRIVLTSRGKPKAALVSIEDYEWLVRAKNSGGVAWRKWFDESAALSEEILERRKGVSLAVDAVRQANHADLEERDAAGS